MTRWQALSKGCVYLTAVVRPQPLSTTVIPADRGSATTRASLVQAIMDKVQEVMVQQEQPGALGHRDPYR